MMMTSWTASLVHTRAPSSSCLLQLFPVNNLWASQLHAGVQRTSQKVTERTLTMCAGCRILSMYLLSTEYQATA